MNRRVVVTGVGLVCGCGIGTDEVWRNLLAGKSGGGLVATDAVEFAEQQLVEKFRIQGARYRGGVRRSGRDGLRVGRRRRQGKQQ